MFEHEFLLDCYGCSARSSGAATREFLNTFHALVNNLALCANLY